MRKKLIIILVLFIVNILSSQSNIIKAWGIQGGMLQSRLYHWNDPSRTTIFDPINEGIGFEFGIFSEIFRFKYLTLGSEIYFIRKTFSWEIIRFYDGPEFSETINAHHNLDYISAVFLSQIKFLDLTSDKFFLLFGPRIDIYYNNRIYSPDDKSLNTKWSNDYLSDSVNGIVFGLRVEKKLVKYFNIFTDVRYSIDLSSPFKRTLQNHNFRIIEILFGVKII